MIARLVAAVVLVAAGPPSPSTAKSGRTCLGWEITATYRDATLTYVVRVEAPVGG